MRLEINTRYLFVCLDFILVALVLLKLLHKSNRQSSPKSPHGLSHLPGTWFSRFTSLGPLLALLRLRKAPYIEDLFEQYGDVVRVSPNQVRLIHLSSHPHPIAHSLCLLTLVDP
jgi:hypothetical protein